MEPSAAPRAMSWIWPVQEGVPSGVTIPLASIAVAQVHGPKKNCVDKLSCLGHGLFGFEKQLTSAIMQPCLGPRALRAFDKPSSSVRSKCLQRI